MNRRSLLTSLALTLVTVFTMHTAVLAGGGNTGWQRVRANLNGNTLASGKADYRERMRNGLLEQRFSVEVEDATVLGRGPRVERERVLQA